MIKRIITIITFMLQIVLQEYITNKPRGQLDTLNRRKHDATTASEGLKLTISRSRRVKLLIGDILDKTIGVKLII